MKQLYKHQKKWIEKNHSKRLLAFDTGVGKTPTAIRWLDTLDIKKALIICPKSVKEKWVSEVLDWREGKWKCTVMSKEEFRDKFDKDKRYDAVVVDESHCFCPASPQVSKLFSSLNSYLNNHEIEYRLLMTATPYLRSSLNILRHGQLLGKKWSFWKWREFWQYRYSIGKRVIWEDKKDIKEDLAKVTRSIGDVMASEEVYDVPEQKEIMIEAVCPSHDFTPRDIGDWVKLHKHQQGLKAPAIKKILDKGKYKKIIIVAKYHDQMEELQQQFETPYIISGKHQDREKVIMELQNKDQYILICSAGVSEGWELPDTECLIFASHDFSYKNFKQMLGRTCRINKPSKTNIYHVLAKGGIDKDVFHNLSRKQDFSMEIYGKI